MKIKSEHYAVALYNALSHSDEKDHKQIMGAFVEMLKERGHLALFERIAKDFLAHERKLKGISEVSVTFAREGLSEADVLKNIRSVTGDNAQVSKHVEEKLIGGVKVESENWRIDASLKKQLGRLQKILNN